MIKRLLSLTLCGLMLLSFAACSRNDTANTDNTSDNAHQTQAHNVVENETKDITTTVDTTSDETITVVPNETESPAEEETLVSETTTPHIETTTLPK